MKKLRCGGKRAHYPGDWEAVSLRIRFGRAGGRCECSGECDVDHGGRCELKSGDPIFRSCVTSRRAGRGRVVLTVAHLNRPNGPCQCRPLCGNDAHLKAMCQGCHLRYDGAKHQRNAAETRLRKRGQLALPVLGEVFGS